MKKKTLFLILFLFIISFLYGCIYNNKISKKEITNISIDYSNQGIHNPKSVLKTKNKFYIDYNGCIYSIGLKNFEAKLVTTLTYIDDKYYRSSIDDNIYIDTFKKIEKKSFLPDIHLVDNKIFYIAEVMEKGETYYKLSSVDLEGKNKTDYITFYDEVIGLKVCDDYFIISIIKDSKSHIYLYDKNLNFKEIFINGRLKATYKNYIISEVVEHEIVDIYAYDVISGKSKLILHDFGFVESISDGLLSTTKLNNFNDMNSDYKSFVFNFRNMNKLLEFENLIPLFFDEKYIYLSKGIGKQDFIKTDKKGEIIHRINIVDKKDYVNYSHIIANIGDNLICMDNKIEYKYYILNLKDKSVKEIDFRDIDS